MHMYTHCIIYRGECTHIHEPCQLICVQCSDMAWVSFPSEPKIWCMHFYSRNETPFVPNSSFWLWNGSFPCTVHIPQIWWRIIECLGLKGLAENAAFSCTMAWEFTHTYSSIHNVEQTDSDGGESWRAWQLHCQTWAGNMWTQRQYIDCKTKTVYPRGWYKGSAARAMADPSGPRCPQFCGPVRPRRCAPHFRLGRPIYKFLDQPLYPSCISSQFSTFFSLYPWLEVTLTHPHLVKVNDWGPWIKRNKLKCALL